MRKLNNLRYALLEALGAKKGYSHQQRTLFFVRSLNKNEIRLLIVFCGAVLIAGSVLLIRSGFGSAAKNREEIALLSTRYQNYLRLQQQASYWEVRKEWIHKHPLPVYDTSRSDSDFVERIQKSLTAMGLRIEEQQIKGSGRKDSFVTAILVVKITGDLEPFVRWVVATQKAGNYLSISKLNLKADSAAMVATVELSQFFCPQKSHPRT